jgi:hypothetical protein
MMMQNSRTVRRSVDANDEAQARTKSGNPSTMETMLN